MANFFQSPRWVGSLITEVWSEDLQRARLEHEEAENRKDRTNALLVATTRNVTNPNNWAPYILPIGKGKDGGDGKSNGRTNGSSSVAQTSIAKTNAQIFKEWDPSKGDLNLNVNNTIINKDGKSYSVPRNLSLESFTNSVKSGVAQWANSFSSNAAKFAGGAAIATGAAALLKIAPALL